MKIICIGRNYREHALELNNPVPAQPVIFLKPDTALLRNNQTFYLPPALGEIHYEAEIILRICKKGKSISPRFASRYFDSIGLGIDFTARDLQQTLKEKGLPWELSKAFDGSAAISEFIPLSTFPNHMNFSFRLEINDVMVQEGHSRDLIFPFAEIISFASQYFSLKTGDLFFTGTPKGVGPVKIGDRLRGFLENRLMFDFLIG